MRAMYYLVGAGAAGEVAVDGVMPIICIHIAGSNGVVAGAAPFDGAVGVVAVGAGGAGKKGIGAVCAGAAFAADADGIIGKNDIGAAGAGVAGMPYPPNVCVWGCIVMKGLERPAMGFR